MKPSALAIAFLAAAAALPAAAQRTPEPARPVKTAPPPMSPRAVDAHTLGMTDADVIRLGHKGEPMLVTKHGLEPLVAVAGVVETMPMEPLAAMPSKLAHEPLLYHTTPAPLPPSKAGEARPTPRAPWAPSDTADSLYRAAREALNRSEYSACGRGFRELREKHPRSQYVPDATYWEAFCLYRVGGASDLRSAKQLLRTAQQAGTFRQNLQADAITLSARITSALARGGDPEAIEEMRRIAQQGASCDTEEMMVKAEALNALVQSDETAARPLLLRVIANRDKCTTELRKRAVYLLVRKPDSTALQPLLEVVRNDPETEVRTYAVQYLSRVPGRAADQALQEILRSSTDERVQTAAVRAIAGREDWSGLRALIERGDVRPELRAAALQSISRERSGAEDAAWVRALYAKVSEPALREEVVGAVGRIGGEENERWLVALASNTNEPARVRTAAIRGLGRSQVPVAQISRIYDASSERTVRVYLVRLLGERAAKDEAAIDKLIEVVRRGTDPEVQRTAISVLTKYRDNAKVRKLLEELIG